MNSSDLDFANWIAWSAKAVDDPSILPGIYAFRIKNATLPRLKGRSDILCIGGTRPGRKSIGSIERRLRQHLVVRDDKLDIGYRLSRVLAEIGPVEVAGKELKDRNEPAFIEAILLNQYAEEHLELPPLNRQQIWTNACGGVAMACYASRSSPQDRARGVGPVTKRDACCLGRYGLQPVRHATIERIGFSR